MAKRIAILNQNETDDSWNSVVLSLATNGGFIISNGKLSQIHVCSPKFNYETLLIENIFQTFWIETKKLNELYSCIFIQQDELNLHADDKEEQEKIAIEREEALITLKNIKNNRKKSSIIDPSDHDEDYDHHEHEGD